jgi:hypothetical protein
MRDLAFEARMKRYDGSGYFDEYFAALPHDGKVAWFRGIEASCCRSIILGEAKDRALARDRWQKCRYKFLRDTNGEPSSVSGELGSIASALGQDAVGEGDSVAPMGQLSVPVSVGEDGVVLAIQLGAHPFANRRCRVRTCEA